MYMKNIALSPEAFDMIVSRKPRSFPIKMNQHHINELIWENEGS